MSEYQRYEFMTVDRSLTAEQIDAVDSLSSHIEVTPTRAVVEYNWGDFKHDPIKVLREFFDGFLYWANWGSPRLAFRFPHGVLPPDLIEDYDFDDLVTFTKYGIMISSICTLVNWKRPTCGPTTISDRSSPFVMN